MRNIEISWQIGMENIREDSENYSAIKVSREGIILLIRVCYMYDVANGKKTKTVRGITY